MFKKMILTISAVISAVLLCAPVTAFAAANGFTGGGGYTESRNGYFFDYDNAVFVDSGKEVVEDFYFDEFYAGSALYVPLAVYEGATLPGRLSDAVTVTAQMVKKDDVTVSTKVLTGSKYVGEIELMDPKKLKITGLESGMYVRIPFVSDYEKYGKSKIRLDMVLAVRGISYQDTRTTLECYIINRAERINRNTVYGAKSPIQYEVSNNYNGNVTFDFGNNVKFTVIVRGRDKYYLNLSKEPDKNIADMYSDKNTFLDFYNFIGDEDTFRAAGKLEIPVNLENLSKKGIKPSLYVYRIDGNSLTSLDSDTVSFDQKTSKLIIRTDTLDNYVLSNRALMQDIEEQNSGDILKTGYATYEEALEESQASSSSSSTASSTTGAVSSTASANLDGAPTPGDLPDDSYAPEEDYPANIPNDNVNTGLPINAANVSSDNPSTSDSQALPAAFAGLALAAAMLLCLTRKDGPILLKP